MNWLLWSTICLIPGLGARLAGDRWLASWLLYLTLLAGLLGGWPVALVALIGAWGIQMRLIWSKL